MKKLLFLDFESAWESKKGGYGLKQLSTVEYIRDPRFKAFGLGYAWADSEGGPRSVPVWISGSQIANFCSQIANEIGWPNIALVGHNVKFDGMILREIYGCVPGQFICTKSMSRGVLGKTVKAHRLEAVAEHLGLPPKGTMHTDGLTELTPAQEKELAEYCLHDVELCREIYYKLSKEFPASQYEVMHRTVEMFICPKTVLNVALLEKTNEDEIERRKNIFETINIPKATFSSNVKFANLLTERGYVCPRKQSPRTGKEIPALALGDTEFVLLMENGNDELKALCEARIAAKSNLLETRSAKLASIGRTGYWPFDVEFSGADQTHRFSGGSGAGGNPQNFTRDSALREAVEAPQGFNLVVGDFDKVECRMVAYLSRDPGLIAAIEGDAYSAFASNYYGRKITKADKAERRFGKCLAEGTLVLCEKGWTRIEQVTKHDKVWDGKEWVKHQGLQKNGVKETIGLQGLWLTPDHRVWCGNQWKESQYLVQDESILFRALDFAKENLPLQDISEAREEGLLPLWLHACVESLNTRWISTISRVFGLHVAQNVLKKLRGTRESCIGVMPESSNRTNIENGFLTESVPPFLDATIQKIVYTAVMAGVGYGFIKNGEMIEVHSSDIYLLSRGGINRIWKWIGSTIIAVTNQITFGLVQGKKILIIDDSLKISKRKLPVYDLLSVGPRNRFTVLTAKGPIIVHNCAILGLGYGMGAKKFQRVVKLQTGIAINEEEAKRGVGLYREMYNKVPALWEYLDSMIATIATGKAAMWPLPGRLGHQYIELPSGLKMRYPNLRQEKGDRNKMEWVYDTWKKGNLERSKLYGGKLLENISQALAGELCKEAMLKFGNRVTGLVHDEIHVIAKAGLELVTKMALQRAMTVSPKWFPELRLKAEVGVGPNWAEAK